MSYHKLEKDRVVYLDIDDSVIMWLPSKYDLDKTKIVQMQDEFGTFEVIPHDANINFVRKLKTQGYGVVMWSAAGVSWVETVIKKLHLEDLPDVIASKPELAVDDLLDATRIIKSVVWIDPVNGDYKRNNQ